MLGNVVNSVPRPAIVTLLTIAAGVPVPVVIASTSATMVMVRCVVALAANVPTSTVILSGFVAVVSEAEAGIVTKSVPTFDVAVMMRIPSGMSSERVTPEAGDGPLFLAAIV